MYNNSNEIYPLLEEALRNNWRWDSSKGQLSLEDLYQLPLTSVKSTSLDRIAVELNTKIHSLPVVSFVNSGSTDNVLLNKKLKVVLHIISVKQEENQRANQLKANQAEREKILEALRSIEEAEFKSKSKEELLEQLNALNS